VPEDATDRSPAPARTQLIADVLAELVVLVAAIDGSAARGR
jgi:hypothetical protein